MSLQQKKLFPINLQIIYFAIETNKYYNTNHKLNSYLIQPHWLYPIVVGFGFLINCVNSGKWWYMVV